MKKILILAFSILLIIAGIYLYLLLKKPPPLEKLIPQEAQSLIGINHLQKHIKSFKRSDFYKGLKESVFLTRIHLDKNIEILLKILGNHLRMATFLKEKGASPGPQGFEQETLLLLETKNKLLLENFIKNKYVFKSKKVKGLEVLELEMKGVKESLYIFFLGNIAGVTNSWELLKKTLNLWKSKDSKGSIASLPEFLSCMQDEREPDFFSFRRLSLKPLITSILERRFAKNTEMLRPILGSFINIFQPLESSFIKGEIRENEIIWERISYLDKTLRTVLESFKISPQEYILLEFFPEESLFVGTGNSIYLENIWQPVKPFLESRYNLSKIKEKVGFSLKDIIISIGPRMGYALLELKSPLRLNSPPPLNLSFILEARDRRTIDRVIKNFINFAQTDPGLNISVKESIYQNIKIKRLNFSIEPHLNFNLNYFYIEKFLVLTNSLEASFKIIDTFKKKIPNIKNNFYFSKVSSHLDTENNGIDMKNFGILYRNLLTVLDFYSRALERVFPNQRPVLIDDIKNITLPFKFLNYSLYQVRFENNKVISRGSLYLGKITSEEWRNFLDSLQNIITYIKIAREFSKRKPFAPGIESENR